MPRRGRPVNGPRPFQASKPGPMFRQASCTSPALTRVTGPTVPRLSRSVRYHLDTDFLIYATSVRGAERRWFLEIVKSAAERPNSTAFARVSASSKVSKR